MFSWTDSFLWTIRVMALFFIAWGLLGAIGLSLSGDGLSTRTARTGSAAASAALDGSALVGGCDGSAPVLVLEPPIANVDRSGYGSKMFSAVTHGPRC